MAGNPIDDAIDGDGQAAFATAPIGGKPNPIDDAIAKSAAPPSSGGGRQAANPIDAAIDAAVPHGGHTGKTIDQPEAPEPAAPGVLESAKALAKGLGEIALVHRAPGGQWEVGPEGQQLAEGTKELLKGGYRALTSNPAEDWKLAQALGTQAAGVVGAPGGNVSKLSPEQEQHRRDLLAAGSLTLGGLAGAAPAATALKYEALAGAGAAASPDQPETGAALGVALPPAMKIAGKVLGRVAGRAPPGADQPIADKIAPATTDRRLATPEGQGLRSYVDIQSELNRITETVRAREGGVWRPTADEQAAVRDLTQKMGALQLPAMASPEQLARVEKIIADVEQRRRAAAADIPRSGEAAPPDVAAGATEPPSVPEAATPSGEPVAPESVAPSAPQPPPVNPRTQAAPAGTEGVQVETFARAPAKERMTFAEQKAAFQQLADENGISRLDLDPAAAHGISQFSGPRIMAMRDQLNTNWAQAAAIDKQLADGMLPADQATALESTRAALMDHNDQLLRGVVRETAAAGRNLGYLNQLAAHSLDPDVWAVNAQRLAGDARIPDAVLADIRNLARIAQEACAGGG